MSAEEQTTRPDKGAKRPSRHAKIMRGVVTPIFGLLAVAAVVLGYMNATMWKPSTEITASATMSGSRYVVTDPNVLTLLDQNATITVDSGSSQDVRGVGFVQGCCRMGRVREVLYPHHRIGIMERAEHPEGKQHESGSAYQCR